MHIEFHLKRSKIIALDFFLKNKEKIIINNIIIKK